jgi:hypothetical protein
VCVGQVEGASRRVREAEERSLRSATSAVKQLSEARATHQAEAMRLGQQIEALTKQAASQSRSLDDITKQVWGRARRWGGRLRRRCTLGASEGGTLGACDGANVSPGRVGLAVLGASQGRESNMCLGEGGHHRWSGAAAGEKSLE